MKVDVPVVGDARLCLEDNAAAYRVSRARGMVRPDQRVEERSSRSNIWTIQRNAKPQYVMEAINAADQGRGDLHHGRGPASDVGGAVHPLALSAADDHQRRLGHDGLWPAGGDGRSWAARANW